jgi:hypothetical protein
MNVIAPVEGTNNIRYADFVRVTTPSAVYRFSTAPYAITVPDVDAEPFDGLGVLVSIGNATRDIKSTANETTITLVGIDLALLGWVLGHDIKGSEIEMWHGFFNDENQLIDDGGTGGLYQFFNGYISTFAISEQWDENNKQFVGVITVASSSVQLILQNRTSGRFTNNNAWQFYNSTDTSMDRVGIIQSLNYPFGKDAPRGN